MGYQPRRYADTYGQPWWAPPKGMDDVDGWLAACREVAALTGDTSVPECLYREHEPCPGDQWRLCRDGSVMFMARPPSPPKRSGSVVLPVQPPRLVPVTTGRMRRTVEAKEGLLVLCRPGDADDYPRGPVKVTL